MKIALTTILILIIFACKKAEDRKCLKSAGSYSTKELVLGDFSTLNLGPHIEFTLVQDTVNKMVLSGPKNLLNFISSEIDDKGKLRVFNDNKCNFLRSYKKIVKATLHFKSIKKIISTISKDLKCSNFIQSEILSVEMPEGSGLLNLDVNCNKIIVSGNGFCRINLRGTSNYGKFEIRDDFDLNAFGYNFLDSVNVSTSSSMTTEVMAENCKLGAHISSSGSVWYKGVPSEIEYLRYGTGKLVDKN